jgi:hypothetical protein
MGVALLQSVAHLEQPSGALIAASRAPPRSGTKVDVAFAQPRAASP